MEDFVGKKLRKIVFAVLMINCCVIMLYYINKQNYIEFNSALGRGSDTGSSITGESELLALHYGEIIPDHVLIDVSHKKYSISSFQDKFHYFKIVSFQDFSETKDIHFNQILKLKRKFEKYPIRIGLLYVMDGSLGSQEKANLIAMQEQYDLPIFPITGKFMQSTYKIPDCNCGYSILLDENNTVRFAHFDVLPIVLETIITKELVKDITYR